MIYVEESFMRGVINGTVRFRKCPACDNDGIEYQAYGDNGEPCASGHEEATRYTCKACGGVAYIQIPEE